MEITIQQITSAGAWGMFALGVLAFVTALLVQAVKAWPPFAKTPTSLIAMVVAVGVTLAAFFAAAGRLGVSVAWYMVAGAVVAGFMVWYIATNGWDKFNELWARFKRDAPEGGK